MPSRILILRLGAMGDILHVLPAMQALRHRYPDAEMLWAVEPKWIPLLRGNPHIDQIIAANRRDWLSLKIAVSRFREKPVDLAVDFQGLIKSALLARSAAPNELVGYEPQQLREQVAGVLYTRQVDVKARHMVERHLALAAALDATPQGEEIYLPPGQAEGDLPEHGYVLCAPFAGWKSKQWPIENYAALAERLMTDFRLPLLMNVAPGAEIPAGIRHESTLDGLIYATRRATAVLGLDSGPMHLAATLGKPGVALFGPTDPARNGPHGGTLRVLRDIQAVTTYKRENEIAPSMRALSVDLVYQNLAQVLSS